MAAILLLAIGETLVWACLYYIFPALLLRWEADLGWTRAELTGAITLAILISGLAAPFAGRIIDRGRGAELMTASAILGAVGLAALSFVNDIRLFYAIWAINGVAMAGALYEPCFAVVTRAKGASAKGAITAITLVAGFAGTISFPAANWAAEAFGWRTTTQLSALIILLVVVPMLWFGVRLLPPFEPVTESEAPSSRRFLTRPAFWFLALSFSCIALIHGSTLHHLLPLLDEAAVPAGLAITVAALIGPSQVAGRIAMVLTSRIVATHGVALAAFLGAGLSILILRTGGASPLSLYAFVICFGAAYGCVSILRPLLARDILGSHNFGAKSGSLALFYLVGSAAAPYLGSLIWGMSGYAMMLNITIALSLAGALLYGTAHRLSAAPAPPVSR